MGYRKLEVYQISYKLTMKIYEASKKYPPTEQYGLTSQIRRASMSIALNIAEGYGRKDSANEFKHFLRNAMGSCNETRVLIEMSRDLGYISEDEFNYFSESYEILSKKLYRLKENWKPKSDI
jgi:four helix bundle protein